VKLDQIGLQLYTVRTAAADDFLGTLRAVAAMGYPAVEFAGLHGQTAAVVRAEMNATGLKAPSAHVPYANLLGDAEAVCADLHTLGCEYAIIPWIGEEHRDSVEAARKFVATINPIAEAVAGCGLTLGYHNHDFEFAPLAGGDGTTLWDLIMAETDPAQVMLELDCYWSTYGGADTLALLKASPERYPLLHFKDMQGDGADRHDAAIGTGNLDFAPILEATAATTEWYIVEQDVPADPLVDAETSLRGMQALTT
jgi:sugar phosphate isomerase/epimerase